MLRKNLVLIVLMVSLKAGAQVNRDTFLLNYDENRILRQKSAMYVLGSWSLINLAGGLYLRSQSSGDSYYFHEMNAGWNTVNLAIAGSGLLKLRKENPTSAIFESLDKSLKYERALLFNAGLDLAYMAGGLYLLERGMHENTQRDRERFRGYGRSIILQGGFLLLYDTIFYLNETRWSSSLREAMQSIYLMPNGVGMHIQF